MAEPTKIETREHFKLLLDRLLPESDEKYEIFEYLEMEQQRERELDRASKKQALDFTTIIESAKQIAKKTLDLGKFEAYTISTFRGQFGVMKVLFFRQETFESPTIKQIKRKNSKDDPFEISLESELCLRLAEQNKPYRIGSDPEFDKCKDVQLLKMLGAELVIPLVNSGDRPGDSFLKGVIALGPKFTNQAFSSDELKLMALLSDMVAVSLNNAQLYHKSIIDALTQVYSRGHFDAHLHQEMARASRIRQQMAATPKRDPTSGQFVSLILVDIDFFKKFNDTYGHQTGDSVLRATARTLHDNVRDMDIVSRYGGEEFAVVLPETSNEQVVVVANRLCEAVRKMVVPTEEYGDLSLTASFGVATYPLDATNIEQLIKSADEALYKSKENGRNQVTLAAEIAAKKEVDG
ncbi:MAG: sensor domain-containing diguanylate cyclase [Planctomycetes bacterium]|nr:sensor domain-containing diguanylate cyclase [Planctomycetota bacterium]